MSERKYFVIVSLTNNLLPRIFARLMMIFVAGFLSGLTSVFYVEGGFDLKQPDCSVGVSFRFRITKINRRRKK